MTVRQARLRPEYAADYPGIPAGTWLLVTGGFDNSAANPANPDAYKGISFGKQAWDEMFIGFFEAADDPEGP